MKMSDPQPELYNSYIKYHIILNDQRFTQSQVRSVICVKNKGSRRAKIV